MKEQPSRTVNCSCCGAEGERDEFYHDKINDRWACVDLDGCIQRQAARSDLPLVCQVAQKVFGYKMQIVYPEWYRGLPVYCFYDPEFAKFGMTYSWDANACNASMYRNGQDGEYAEHLPHWDWEDDGMFLQVIERMTERGYHFRLYSYRTQYRQTDDPFRPIKEEKEHLEYEAEFMPYRSDHSERYIVRAGWAARAVCEAAIKAVDGRIQPDFTLYTPTASTRAQEPTSHQTEL